MALSNVQHAMVKGLTLDGFASWKCKGYGQIRDNNKSKKSSNENIDVDRKSTS